MPEWFQDYCVEMKGLPCVLLRGRVDDSRFQEILNGLRASCERQGAHNVFSWWGIERRYSKREMDEAELFRFLTTTTFEPCGEEVGTTYDYGRVCRRCQNTGRVLVGSLKLDLSRVPRGAGFSGTLAMDENVVSERLLSIIETEGLTGCKSSSVEHCRPHRVNLPQVHQFTVTASVGRMAPPTRCGVDPISGRAVSEYACAECGLRGLNLLSEVSVFRNSYQGQDFVVTEDWIGQRIGLLVPGHVTLISRRAAEVLRIHGAKGFKLEVAHLVR